MMKLSRSLFSRKLSSEKVGDLGNAMCSPSFSSRADMSTLRQDFAARGTSAARIFIEPYTVYKGKAALSVAPVLPTFTKLDSGNLKVDRKGVMMLTFTPALGERKYDWEKKQRFALSPTEVGSLISMGPTSSAEFFHDPSMLSSNSGQVRKSLKIKAHADGSGYFISLGVVNNLLKTTDQFSVPVTTAEFAVMKIACSFALPHLIGWDRLTNQTRGMEVAGKFSKMDSKILDSEWDK